MPRHRNASTARPIEGGVRKKPRKSDLDRRSLEPGGHHKRGPTPPIPPLPDPMPSTACFRCAARGWCGHDGRDKP
jgi:hypothetical protein